MTDDPYFYPGTTVLRNKLGIRDSAELDRIGRLLATQRTRQGPPKGDFDLPHLQAIHRHLFQDMYVWAGELRTLEISKGGHQFQFRQYIEIGMNDVHRRLVASKFLERLPRATFSERAGEIIGDVNYVHPFREGNGRAQLQYLKQLAERAGHTLDLTRLSSSEWLHASREAHQARYGAMASCIAGALVQRSRVLKGRQSDQTQDWSSAENENER